MEPEGSLSHSQEPPPVPILSHIDPVHALPHCFLRIHFNIIFLSTPRSSGVALFLSFPHQNPVWTSPVSHMVHVCLVIGLVSRMIYGEYKSWNSSLHIFLQSLLNSAFQATNILLSILLSYIFSLCSTLSVRDQGSHPYKTTGKVIILRIRVFTPSACPCNRRSICITTIVIRVARFRSTYIEQS